MNTHTDIGIVKQLEEVLYQLRTSRDYAADLLDVGVTLEPALELETMKQHLDRLDSLITEVAAEYRPK